jgi:hypothetical protein
LTRIKAAGRHLIFLLLHAQDAAGFAMTGAEARLS